MKIMHNNVKFCTVRREYVEVFFKSNKKLYDIQIN